MAKKYRTTGHDVLAPKPKAKPQDKAGTIPAHKLGVYDHRGRLRAQVGFKMTAAGVSRFLDGRAAYLSKDEKGRQCWKGMQP